MTTTDHRGHHADSVILDEPYPPPPAPANIREAAINSALYALGDSALTHDGYLRPRVWELADQIGAYIATGDRPGSVEVCLCQPTDVGHPQCPTHGNWAGAS